MSGINVSSVDFQIMSKERKLELSKGEILVEGAPIADHIDKSKLYFPDDGLFSEKIFGPSRDSVKGAVDARFSDSMPPRMKNFGHICLKVPFVLPYLYSTNGSKINILLGMTGPKLLKSIIEWEAVMIRTVRDTPQEKFLGDLAHQKISGGVKSIEITSAYKRHFKVKKVSSSDKDSVVEETIVYYYVPLGYLEKLSKNVDNPRYKSLDYWNSPDSNSVVFMGAYAILHLMSFMDLNEEIIFSATRLDWLKQQMIGADTVSKKDKTSKEYKNGTERYQMLVNYKKRDLPLESITSDILLVMPAGLRDVSLRTDSNGAPAVSTFGINKRYKEVLSSNKAIDKYGTFLTPEEIMNTRNNIEWARQIPTKQEFINKAKRIQLEVNEITMKEIASKVGKKEGRFRQTILSRRLDYTGRGVITPDPELELDELGVPIYILNKIIGSDLKGNSKLNSNISKEQLLNFLKSNDKKQLIKMDVESPDAEGLSLEFSGTKASQEEKINTIREFYKILDDMRVLAIRFPSLHKYNLLGFRIKIVYDYTIHLHPLVCAPYNADFDGDQMSLYLVQTPEAVSEVDNILLPSKNLMNTNGSPLITPSQDAVLGSYYMTLEDKKHNGEIPVFNDFDSMYKAYQMNRVSVGQKVTVLTPHYEESDFKRKYREYVHLRQSIKNSPIHGGVPFSDLVKEDSNFVLHPVSTYQDNVEYRQPRKYITSTVGRFIFNQSFPQDLGFVNREADPHKLEIEGVIERKGNAGMASGDIKAVIERTIKTKPLEEVIFVLDSFKELGYKYATLSGMSMSAQDIFTHPEKPEILKRSFKQVEEINRKESEGEITKPKASQERIAVWRDANDELTDKTLNFLPDDNPIKMMSVSGSRGNRTQIAQLMGMRGLMADTSANIIETPVTSSFLEGLSMVEYFTASYGARKGIFDRSNRTKETGETTRTSVYGTEKLMVRDGDCGDTEGIEMTVLRDNDGNIIKKVTERIKGKFLLEDLIDEKGNVVLSKGKCVLDDYTHLEPHYENKSIKVRSPITCKHRLGLCAKCYGYNYGANRYANIGDAAGVIASQTIGEPGTQLTMRTFHTGGVAKDDITQGFTMVRSLLETKKYPLHLSQLIDEAREVDRNEIEEIQKEVVDNLEAYIDDNLEDIKEKVGMTFSDYGIANADLYIEVMTTVKELLQVAYQTQGINLLDTHYEVIARSMGTLLEVEEQGDTIYPMGQIVNWAQLESTNIEMVKRGLQPMIVKPTLNSLKAVAASNQSPFTAMTYQDINKVLSSALTLQGEDDLTNPMSSAMVSNVLASGESGRRYISKSRKKYENVISNRELMDNLGIPMYEENEQSIEPEKDIVDQFIDPIIEPELDWEPIGGVNVDDVITEHNTPTDLDWEVNNTYDNILDDNLEGLLDDIENVFDSIPQEDITGEEVVKEDEDGANSVDLTWGI